MDKQSLILILSKCFEIEGNVADLHLVGDKDLLIDKIPKFFSSHMQVVNEYTVNLKQIKETICVPFSSVIYVTLTNSENLKIIHEQYMPLKMDEEEFGEGFFEE